MLRNVTVAAQDRLMQCGPDAKVPCLSFDCFDLHFGPNQAAHRNIDAVDVIKRQPALDRICATHSCTAMQYCVSNTQ